MRVIFSLLLFVWVWLPLNAQRYRDKFDDGVAEDYTVLTSDARNLPHVLVGFRLSANPFFLYENSGKFLIKAEYAYLQVGLYSRAGVEAFIPLIKRHPLGKSKKIELGIGGVGRTLQYNQHYIRIKNLVKTQSYGFHASYNYMIFREDAHLRTTVDRNFFVLNNFRGHEFSVGLGLFTRRGLAVSSDNIKTGAIEKLTYRSFLFSCNIDLIVNMGYAYDVKTYAIYGDTLPWKDENMKFPQIGYRAAFDMYWNPGWSGKNRTVSVGFSWRFAVQRGFIEGINAAFFVPELMWGIHFNILQPDKLKFSEIAPVIEIWSEKRQYRPQPVPQHW